MFEDLREAWKQAVENFWRELDGDGDAAAGGEARKQLSAMRREVGSADDEIKRLEGEIQRARIAVATERREEETCRRRMTMAEGIGDEETARVANTFAERAAERAAVLQRKAEALEAEQALRARDLAEMRAAVDAAAAALGAATRAAGAAGPGPADAAGVGAGEGSAAGGSAAGGWPPDPLADEARAAQEQAFRRMQREAREKAAEARLEELKRRMR